MVWYASEGGDYDIYFWDGATVTQITDNTTDDRYPAISGSNVVWEGHDGEDTEIFFWQGGTTTQITHNEGTDRYAAISGSNVVWEGRTTILDDSEIYLMRGGPWSPRPPFVPFVPGLSTPALALLAGLLTGTALWLVRRQRVAGV